MSNYVQLYSICFFWVVLYCTSLDYDCPKTINGTIETITIRQNYTLTRIYCPNITCSPGQIEISDNDVLETIVFTKLAVGGYLTIQVNNALSTIDLPQLTKLGGSLLIGGNAELKAIKFPLLTEINGFLYIWQSKLHTIRFPYLTTIEWYVQIWQNNELESVIFPKLTTIGTYLQFNLNLALELVILPKLTTVCGYIRISSNPVLDTVILSDLTIIGGDLDISSNQTLIKIEFPNLTQVHGYVSMNSLPRLRNISLTSLAIISDHLDFKNNHYLQHIGLDTLISVHQSVTLYRNDNIQNVLFPRLQTIGRSLYIQENKKLIDLQFANLYNITLDLYISNNILLHRIYFPVILSIGKTVRISRSSNLFRIILNPCQCVAIITKFDFYSKCGSYPIHVPDALYHLILVTFTIIFILAILLLRYNHAYIIEDMDCHNLSFFLKEIGLPSNSLKYLNHLDGYDMLNITPEHAEYLGIDAEDLLFFNGKKSFYSHMRVGIHLHGRPLHVGEAVKTIFAGTWQNGVVSEIGYKDKYRKTTYGIRLITLDLAVGRERNEIKLI